LILAEGFVSLHVDFFDRLAFESSFAYVAADQLDKQCIAFGWRPGGDLFARPGAIAAQMARSASSCSGVVSIGDSAPSRSAACQVSGPAFGPPSDRLCENSNGSAELKNSVMSIP